MQMSLTSLLNSERISEIEENRRHVKTLLKVVSFLCRQGLAFMGHKESETENKVNFLKMLETVCEEDPKLKERIRQYQNDLISVFSLRILRCIIKKAKEAGFTQSWLIKPRCFQLTILIRYGDCEDWKIKERAIGLHHLKDCSAENIANAILSLLSEQGFDLKYCVGQCYDSANVMNEYFFCTLLTIYCFISNSSVRYELFPETQRKLKQPVMCLERFIPTQWFCWFSVVSKILKNSEAVLIVLDEGIKDRAESIGIRAQMEQQCFIFFLYAMEQVLGITYSLSQQLQSKDIDFIVAGCLIKSTKEELARQKEKKALTLHLTDSVVFISVEQMERNTRSIYFNILDTVMHEFDCRFSEDQGDIMEATNDLKKTEVSFFYGQVLNPLVNKYQAFVNVDLLEKQLPLARNFLQLHMSFLDSLSLPVVAAQQFIKQNEADLEALSEILLSETKLVEKKGSSLLDSKSEWSALECKGGGNRIFPSKRVDQILKPMGRWEVGDGWCATDDVLKLQQILRETRQVWEATAKQRDCLQADIECATRERLQCRVKQQEADSEKGTVEARCADMMQQLATEVNRPYNDSSGGARRRPPSCSDQLTAAQPEDLGPSFSSKPPRPDPAARQRI
ncbi:hypothetical protein PR048_008649 [Dryococelus australis]|uniref:DUF4371 domain-containing protein n=1 Tax=Dryococelus australis TaxID=614101 RepID=A0ABQ9HXN4_9NEOP|nr:hypothetical protein PR048_008649 [Dryococelus australis]